MYRTHDFRTHRARKKLRGMLYRNFQGRWTANDEMIPLVLAMQPEYAA